ncbi:transcriptional repressor TCF25-domain-containing protein [Protomyces lactucae-debilis]|uniref:Transcriptional repressor TCF25-domain-containing protein n=1 Tax=Protomyces lactucae-debilis TaxID=2754530 RepID=A0A1Y2EU45_PROLT|nr:transcriptional repressor TCF25-domain-containing protein [Protomyces lactucae-debilis]ORY74814.1 transcriptional repressor TCF25-domain-containing protein [Protomyces lactucae-debilis]
MPRALRKAQKQKQELELQQAPVPVSDEGSDKEEEDTRSAPNPFDLLNAADDQDEDDDEEEEEEQAQLTTQDEELDADEQEDVDAAIEASLSPSKPKRKKKKNKQKAKQPASVTEDDFKAALQAHQSAVAGTTADPTLPAPFHLANLLSIDVKMLDPAAEMRQFFGSKVVHSEQQERQATLRRQLPRGLNMPMQRGRKSVLVPIDDNWPAQIRGGLEMLSLGEDDGIRLFRFQHPKAYAEQQLRFLEAVGSGDPQVLLNLLGSAPFHVDTLLQASEIFRHQGNHEESGEMLARALYAFDRALHPLFKIATGMVRLPFEIPENRSFYLCIYRYIQSLGRRGLWQTAFEYNKLLYALAPEEDPYAALLSLDYYALKAKRFDYVTKLAEAPWEAILDDNTSHPGMLYSRALSKWLTRPKKPVDAAWEAEAMALMQQAAQAYPAIPAALFAAASAQGPVQWQQVSCTHMQAMHRDLFVFRHKDIYGIPENLAFLRTALLEQDPPLESTHNDESVCWVTYHKAEGPSCHSTHYAQQTRLRVIMTHTSSYSMVLPMKKSVPVLEKSGSVSI